MSLEPLHLGYVWTVMCCAGKPANQDCQCNICKVMRLSCESPIETRYACELVDFIRNHPELYIDAQFKIGRFRYDFAIFEKGRKNPVVLIECDGKDFHSTNEQITNDRAKDEAAIEFGAPVLRFTGSEIFRDAETCVINTMEIVVLLSLMNGKTIGQLSAADRKACESIVEDNKDSPNLSQAMKSYLFNLEKVVAGSRSFGN